MSLLFSRKFWPLFATQFLGAFNDNLFKNALILTITFADAAESSSSSQLVALTGAVFILPFFLFSAVAGELADKYPKARLMRFVKVAEIAIMAIAAAGFVLQSLPLLFVALFFMGTHSTVFGPLKYGALPELLEQGDLVGGNALVEMGTFLAILLGTIGGGALIALGAKGRSFVAIFGLIVAFVGWLMARQIPEHRAIEPTLSISRGVFRPTWSLMKFAAKEESVLHSVLGISWFWLVGAVVLSVLPNLVKVHLHGTEAVVTYLLALFSIGVGVGSVLCKRLSFRQLELGLVPFGSFGITFFLVDSAITLMGHAPAGATNIVALLGTARGIRLSIDLTLFAVSSGVFIVPLYTLLQERSAENVRARVIAANNVVNALFMVIGSVLLSGLIAAGGTIPQILLVLALMNFIVAIYIYTVIPEFLFRLVCFCLAHVMYRLQVTGRDHIPLNGAAVLVCNHVTFVDWLIISAATQRPIRFVMYYQFTSLPFTGRIFRDAKVIPIASAKESPQILEDAFTRIAAELDAGELVCIFPEGKLTTDGKMAPFRRGIERIIERNPVFVIPMHLDGLWESMFSRYSRRRLFRRLWSRIKLTIGEPISPVEITAAVAEEKVTALAG